MISAVPTQDMIAADTYLPVSKVEFAENHSLGLKVDIWTKRLHLRSVTLDDVKDYTQLFLNAESIEMYADGNPRSPEQTEKRIQGWVNRWQNADPFSALRVELKDGTFIGHVIMGYGDEAGHAELAYLLHKKYWSNGYGTEAVAAVVNDLAREILKRGYPVNKDDKDVPPAKLQIINATSREDNVRSNKILEKLGFESVDKNFKWGNWRHVYQLPIMDVTKGSASHM